MKDNEAPNPDTQVSNMDLNPALFKNYRYGDPESNFSSSQYEDCSEFFGVPATCGEDVEFLGQQFSTAFIFDNKNLTKCILYAPYDVNLLSGLMLSLPKNEFYVVGVVDSEVGTVDLFQYYNKYGKAAGDEKFQYYLNRAISSEEDSDIVFTLVEGKDGILKKKINNLQSLLKDLGPKVRMCDLGIVYDEDEDGYYIALTFYLKAEIDKLIKRETF